MTRAPTTTSDELRRLTDQSRIRITAVLALREDCSLIARQSERRLAAGRLLLDRCRSAPRV